MKNLLVLFFTLLSTAILAQSSNGSIYSAFGIGDLKQTGFGAFASMGYNGVAARSRSFVNEINPASYNAITNGNQVFDFGFHAGSIRQSTASISETKGDGGLSHLNLLFKPKEKWGLNIGLRQLSKVSYDFVSENRTFDGIGLYSVNYSGTGGLTQFDVANSFSVFKNFNIGIRTSLLFGGIDKQQLINSSSVLGNLAIINREFYAKALFDLGVQYTIEMQNSDIHLGATWNPGASAFSFSTQIIQSEAGDTLSDPLSTELGLPEKLTLGIGLSWRSFNFYSDFGFEKWDQNENQNDIQFNNVFRYGIGMEYVQDPLSTSYFQRVIWRTGFSINNHYLEINDTPFNESTFTFGLSLPVLRGTSHLNLGYELSQRGTTSNNLILESNQIFSVGVTIRDLWFLKTAYH